MNSENVEQPATRRPLEPLVRRFMSSDFVLTDESKTVNRDCFRALLRSARDLKIYIDVQRPGTVRMHDSDVRDLEPYKLAALVIERAETLAISKGL